MAALFIYATPALLLAPRTCAPPSVRLSPPSMSSASNGGVPDRNEACTLNGSRAGGQVMRFAGDLIVGKESQPTPLGGFAWHESSKKSSSYSVPFTLGGGQPTGSTVRFGGDIVVPVQQEAQQPAAANDVIEPTPKQEASWVDGSRSTGGTKVRYGGDVVVPIEQPSPAASDSTQAAVPKEVSSLDGSRPTGTSFRYDRADTSVDPKPLYPDSI